MLFINNKFINFEESVKGGVSKEDIKVSLDGIWMFIDEKGYFNFDFKMKCFDNLELKEGNDILLIFVLEDDEDVLKFLIFKIKVISLEDIEKVEIKYDYVKVKEVNVLKDVNEELYVDEIYGSLYYIDKGKGIFDKEGIKVIKGKIKFVNVVVKVYLELGEV